MEKSRDTGAQVQVEQISMKIGLRFLLDISSGIFGRSLMSRALCTCEAASWYDVAIRRWFEPPPARRVLAQLRNAACRHAGRAVAAASSVLLG